MPLGASLLEESGLHSQLLDCTNIQFFCLHHNEGFTNLWERVLSSALEASTPNVFPCNDSGVF